MASINFQWPAELCDQLFQQSSTQSHFAIAFFLNFYVSWFQFAMAHWAFSFWWTCHKKLSQVHQTHQTPKFFAKITESQYLTYENFCEWLSFVNGSLQAHVMCLALPTLKNFKWVETVHATSDCKLSKHKNLNCCEVCHTICFCWEDFPYHIRLWKVGFQSPNENGLTALLVVSQPEKAKLVACGLL